MQAVLITLLRGYKILLSPLLPRACRFLPTCSIYAAEAVARHGAWTGARLALRRIARCHPFGGSGFDPVPTVVEKTSATRYMSGQPRDRVS